MRRDLKVYFIDILESIERIEEYTKDISEKEFYMNVQLQDSILRRLSIIGEAVKNISSDIKEKYPMVPWKQIAGMRDILIHEYFGVNLKRVWSVIEKDLPELKETVQKIEKSHGRLL